MVSVKKVTIKKVIRKLRKSTRLL